MTLIEKIELLTDDEIELILSLMRERDQRPFQEPEADPDPFAKVYQ